ncbi:MAG: alkaline phosphatase D family protein [Fluviicola sp.]|nr:alkaline phosphatase D family protein [Fluviicola sp.]
MIRLIGFSVMVCVISFSAIAQKKLRIDDALPPELNPNMAPFYHGVASGDPTQSAVIIWTKLTLESSFKKDITVSYKVSETPDFKVIAQSGKVNTTLAKDYTVKVDVTGLKEHTTYYYCFYYKKKRSITGQTKTLAENPTEMSIAFAACSNYEWGYFTNYRFIAENPKIDVVVHLGDYIYEYAPGGYGDTTIGRKHVPAKEITTLQDYRTRYAQYRLDPDLQLAHQLKPFVTTWDDHEIANNAYVDGAQNHQETEGDWYERKHAGKQAYYEWMPVRETPEHELYRAFRVGNLLNLIILDTRIAGRSVQLDSISDPHFQDVDRTILGTDQYQWLTQQLKSGSKWQIIGNQVPFGPMYTGAENNTKQVYMDGWDGYPAERKRLIDWFALQALENVVWVTGDYHASFAMENDLTGTKDTSDNVSVEFIVTSITSANSDEWTDNQAELDAEQAAYMANNPQLRYLNGVDHGFMVLHVTSEKAEAQFYYASDIRTKTGKLRLEKLFTVLSGSSVLKE